MKRDLALEEAIKYPNNRANNYFHATFTIANDTLRENTLACYSISPHLSSVS